MQLSEDIRDEFQLQANREIPADMRQFINSNRELVSLLYDLDLLPEQLASQAEVTPGLKVAYRRLYSVCSHFSAFSDRIQRP